METDKNEDDEKKKKKGEVFIFSVVSTPRACDGEKMPNSSSSHFSAPKCGFIKGNEKILALLQRVKPEICAFRETIITVSESLSL